MFCPPAVPATGRISSARCDTPGLREHPITSLPVENGGRLISTPPRNVSLFLLSQDQPQLGSRIDEHLAGVCVRPLQ